MTDDKKIGDARGEEIKNQGDSYLQDYLENFRKGLEGYSTSFVRHMDVMKDSMDKQKNDILKTINSQIDTINSRIEGVRGISNEVEQRGSTVSDQIQISELKQIFNHIRVLLDQIEKNLTK